MLGLIYKDFLCLRNNIKLFILVTVGVIALAVCFIISLEQGNIATYIKSEGLTETQFLLTFQSSIILILLLPIASAAVIPVCYKADENAGFAKCMYVFPIKKTKMVGSRYVTAVGLLVMGYLASIITAGTIRLATDALKFKDLMVNCTLFLIILFIYFGYIMFFSYLLDGKKGDMMIFLPIGISVIALFIYVNGVCGNMPVEELEQHLMSLADKGFEFVQINCWWMLLISLAFLAISYLGSVLVVKKRGLL